MNLYATFFRQYDPQIGRLSGVDCQSEESIMMSLYQFGASNPVSYNDPLGNKQTAGLYGGSNSYYNFNPGYTYTDINENNWHHDDPLGGALQWMDSGDDGGGGSGSSDGGDYSNFWGTILNEADQVISKGGKEINKDIFGAPNGKNDGFIIINGKTVNWGDIKTGTFNYLSLVETKTKMQYGNQEIKDYLYKLANMNSNISSNIGQISYGAGLIAVLNKFLGGLQSFYVFSLSEKYSAVSGSYSDLAYLYNNLPSQKGLWVVYSSITRINADIVSYSQQKDFYLPNGPLFFSLQY